MITSTPVIVTGISTKPNSFGYYGIRLESETGEKYQTLWNMGRGEPKPELRMILTLNSTHGRHHVQSERGMSFEYTMERED